MGTDAVNVYDAKTHLSRLIARIEMGDQVTIMRNGRPVARLVPYRNEEPIRRPGAWKGKVVIADDFDEFTSSDSIEWYGE